MFSLLALALALAAASVDDHRAEVERAVFELCPRAMDGSLSLADAGQVAAIGFAPTEPRQTQSGPIPRAVRGSGTAQIVISAPSDERPRLCSVWFGGPDNAQLFRAVRRRARSEGWRGGSAGRLGDGTPIHQYRLGGSPPRTLVIFEADAGGELDFEPATTVIMMP
jgi:hypothetical protein